MTELSEDSEGECKLRKISVIDKKIMKRSDV